MQMQNSHPHVVHDANLSRAWASVFLDMMRTPKNGRPTLVSLRTQGLATVEDDGLRTAVDAHLRKAGKVAVEDNAAMIFPYRTWEHMGRPERRQLYAMYLRMEQRAKARDVRNRYGTYFGRMIDFTGSRGGSVVTVNQVEHILGRWDHRRANSSRPRTSELQISCFDPAKDHAGQALRGFPCLQQLSLAYEGEGLVLSAYYPTQYIFDRAYGNYLGLYRLGTFFAHEMGLNLHRVDCFISSPRLGDVRKRDLRELEAVTAALVERRES